MREVVIVDAVRTPIGRHAGGLSGVRPDDLAAGVIAAAVERTGVDPETVEEVYLGCANQAGEDNRNVARMAALLAGLPDKVAAVTFNRLCASGLNAVNQAARAIAAGEGEVFIAGGVESMSRVALLDAQEPARLGPAGQRHRLRHDAGLALSQPEDGRDLPPRSDGRDRREHRRSEPRRRDRRRRDQPRKSRTPSPSRARPGPARRSTPAGSRPRSRR